MTILLQYYKAEEPFEIMIYRIFAGCSIQVCLFLHDYDDVNILYTPSEHSGVQRKTSAVMESFSQVQKSTHIPEGESVPDFEEKLRPVTAQEGNMNCSLTVKAHAQLQFLVDWCIG